MNSPYSVASRQAASRQEIERFPGLIAAILNAHSVQAAGELVTRGVSRLSGRQKLLNE